VIFRKATLIGKTMRSDMIDLPNQGVATMKKILKDILFAPQVANADTARKEQLFIIVIMLIFAAVLFTVHAIASN